MVGNVAPESAKPLPETVTELMVSAAVPEEVRVSVLFAVVLTVTLPKSMEAALRVRSGAWAAVPVPLRVTVAVLPDESLLEMVMAPTAEPVTVGSKLAWRVRDWPGFSVAGKLALEMAKPLPEAVTELMVSGAVPDEVRVIVLVAVVFTVTLPKLMEPALSVRLGVVAGVPVPLRVTVVVPPDESLLEMVMAPAAGPVATGSKVACRVRDCPGFSVAGNVAPEIAK